MASPKTINPVTTLLDGVSTPGKGSYFLDSYSSGRTFHVSAEGAGALSAQVKIYGSNNPDAEPVVLATVDLTGTGSAADGFFLEAPWKFLMAELVEVTDCSVSVYMGV
jgi:hypothetical protein